MPCYKRSHGQNLMAICILCLRRGERQLSTMQRKLFPENVFNDYCECQDVLPGSVCGNCRRILSYLSGLSPHPLPPDLQYDIMVADLKSLRKVTGAKTDCKCEFCWICRSKDLWKGDHPHSKYASGLAPRGFGHRRLHSLPTSSPVIICFFCHSEVGRGKPHNCNKAAKMKNLQKILSPNTKEQVASSTIKNKVEVTDSRALIKPPTPWGLSSTSSYCYWVHCQTISSVWSAQVWQNFELEMSLSLSNKQIVQAAATLQEDLGKRKAIAPNLKSWCRSPWHTPTPWTALAAWYNKQDFWWTELSLGRWQRMQMGLQAVYCQGRVQGWEHGRKPVSNGVKEGCYDVPGTARTSQEVWVGTGSIFAGGRGLFQSGSS